MDILQNPLLTGLPSLLISLAITVAVGFYINNSAKSKAEELTNNAYEQTIRAQKEYNDILDTRLKDIESENKHLQETIKAILDVLKAREIHITIQDHMISIRDGMETTVTRIREDTEA